MGEILEPQHRGHFIPAHVSLYLRCLIMASIVAQTNMGVPVPSVSDFDWVATLKSKAKDGSCPEQQGKDGTKINKWTILGKHL